MRKNLIPILWIIFLVLPFSCSDLILPKNVNVHGTMDLSIKVMAENWGHAVAKILKEAFLHNSDQIDMIDFDAEVYDVNYGQSEQTFLIHLHSEITNHLDPAEYLKEAAAFLYQIGTSDPFAISYEFDVGGLKEQEFTFQEIVFDNIPGFLNGIPLPPTPIEIPIPPMDLSPDMGEAFLHASIEEGEMEIMVELHSNGDILDDSTFAINYDVQIEQDITSPYSGLSCSIGPLNTMSLKGQHINGGKLNIGASKVTITPKPGAITLSSNEFKIKLTVKIAIQILKEVDLDFLSIKHILDEHQIDPVSLDSVNQYVNYVTYEPQSMGLRFVFDDMIDGLAMAVTSNAMGIEREFQDLIEGTEIKFTNNNAGTLWLNKAKPIIPGYNSFTPSAAGSFDIYLELRPSGGGDVLHIEPAGGITGNGLKINGTAQFFQNWSEAQLNMVNIIKAAPYATGDYIGSIPKEGNDPIDLSVLTDYISGFTFEGIKSELHINGPQGVVNNPNLEGDLHLSLKAYYWWDDINEVNDHDPSIIYDGPLVLEENPLLLDASYFDVNGSYKEKDLPPGRPFSFSDILDEQPKKLVFIYEIKIPDELTVTHDLFEDDSTFIDSKITMTMLIMIPLKLVVANDGPGSITFPDMFKDVNDLFGRNSIEEDSVFNSLNNIEYLKFTIDFTGSFFNGGKLFIEKEGKELLFPNGIGLNGKSLVLNITGADFETIKNNLIDPDLRLIFEDPGGSLNVPRNIGLTNLKFEAKGKFEF